MLAANPPQPAGPSGCLALETRAWLNLSAGDLPHLLAAVIPISGSGWTGLLPHSSVHSGRGRHVNSDYNSFFLQPSGSGLWKLKWQRRNEWISTGVPEVLMGPLTSCFLEEAQAFSGVGKTGAVPEKAVVSDHLESGSHQTTSLLCSLGKLFNLSEPSSSSMKWESVQVS